MKFELPRQESRSVSRDSSRETVKYRPICFRRGFQRKRPRIKQIGRYLSVYPVPICARAPNSRISGELNLRGHHDWPDKRPPRNQGINRYLSSRPK